MTGFWHPTVFGAICFFCLFTFAVVEKSVPGMPKKDQNKMRSKDKKEHLNEKVMISYWLILQNMYKFSSKLQLEIQAYKSIKFAILVLPIKK